LHPPSYPTGGASLSGAVDFLLLSDNINNTAHHPHPYADPYAKTNARPRTASGALTNGRGRRFLQTDGGDVESVDNENENGNGVSVTFVAVQLSIASDFASTFRSASDLSASEVAGSWDVLVTVLVLGGSFAFMIFFAVRADANDYKNSLLKNSVFGTATQ
jgi:hypothetical protein